MLLRVLFAARLLCCGMAHMLARIGGDTRVRTHYQDRRDLITCAAVPPFCRARHRAALSYRSQHAPYTIIQHDVLYAHCCALPSFR